MLKAPIYYGLENALLQVFPDARLVMLHRDPKQTVPSSCKLLEEFHKPFSTGQHHAPTLLQGFATQMARHLALRDQGLPVLDIAFEHLNGPVDPLLERIYAHAGAPLSAGARANAHQWVADHPVHKHGKFEYALADYGLDAATVDQAFAHYKPLLDSLR